jgi:hypothetical protein
VTCGKTRLGIEYELRCDTEVGTSFWRGVSFIPSDLIESSRDPPSGATLCSNPSGLPALAGMVGGDAVALTVLDFLPPEPFCVGRFGPSPQRLIGCAFAGTAAASMRVVHKTTGSAHVIEEERRP